MTENRFYHFNAMAIPKSCEAHVVYERVSLYIMGKFRLKSWKEIKKNKNPELKALYYGLLIDSLCLYANKSIREIELLTGSIDQKKYATYLQQVIPSSRN